MIVLRMSQQNHLMLRVAGTTIIDCCQPNNVPTWDQRLHN